MSAARRGYDRLAGLYRGLEWLAFGDRLHRARVALLDRLPGEGRVLVLGDGDGRLLAAMCRARPRCRFVSVDLSGAMLARQRRRVADASPEAGGRVAFVRADALEHPLQEHGFDALVTAFFLDCFDAEQLGRGLPAWLGAVRPGGTWLLVDFVEPGGRLRRLHARVWLRLMHGFFRWQTGCPNRRLIDWRRVPGTREQRPVARRDACFGMVRSELFTLL
ncbi:class I SAM-dependent methyltransferase [Phycisphaera mikurensis]|uniref:Methyltransferase domain-containing protein n=1 Tax=Phycisphaera mikurensis (strain NBRC 102666 / KCTC 22515 / FYK2301M01) TaxID=1142394 RepID=I0IGM0_PHYMF|nr:class I SAM-dependent methyltransferase [Phycisphaera mikurensis]MBB6442910.1 ubiquinone/menaquinone biosynthesis C-methylase UbiE [Phycisphaera mikurensis]BAM04408.1 hypothetical protein PSMK_22490 [Phycisphaera mikurensis NBRC 102666]